MLAGHRIKLLDFHFFGHRPLVFRGRVEMTSAGGGFQFDFFAHDRSVLLKGAVSGTVRHRLNGFAASTHFGHHHLKPFLVDKPKRSVREAKPYPAVFALEPEPAVLEIGQKPALGFVVGVRNVVSDHRRFAGDLADSGHGRLLGKGVGGEKVSRENAKPKIVIAKGVWPQIEPYAAT
jgi:hypothetical protein